MSHADYSYPLEGWKIREIHFDPAMLGRNETIFALGNGYFGMRGNFEEGHGNVVDGTYLNGFYEEAPIVYGETAYGYARNRQVMLNVADAKVIRLRVDGEPFDLAGGNLIAYQRTLDLASGQLTREVRWVSPSGRLIDVTIRRIVSFVRPHIGALEYSVTARGADVLIEIESGINGRVTNQVGRGDPRVGTHLEGKALSTIKCEATGTDGLVMQQTRTTRMTLACGMAHELDSPLREESPVTVESVSDETGSQATVRFQRALSRGETFRLTKFIGYCTSRERPIGELESTVRQEIAAARSTGFEGLAEEQAEYLRRFWSVADIEIGGDAAVQQGVRYNLFSLLQSAGRDGRTSIAAKGLTGEGYEGHYFWDTEIYVLPFFVYSAPEIARSLLAFRCGILDKARARAREMNQKGALFPWRTIGGEETSPYFPAGSAQYHINADIAFALKRYLGATLDLELLRKQGAELLFETARLWVDLGDWLPPRADRRPVRRNRTELPTSADQPSSSEEEEKIPERLFYINEVTGPDEYTALVNNNAYTNFMAQLNLEFAVSTAEELRAEDRQEYERIARSIDLSDEEVEGWRDAAAAMFIPYDRARGICAQDDVFLKRAVWDFAGTPREKHPLLLNFHPLVIYRYQVLKQPDVVLAQVLRGDCFTAAEKKRNFDYYDPLTTGDSSLSPCIQSVAAVELGYTDRAYAYFMRTARMDLDDINGNVADGVHTAAMAGTWISLVYGFAGMRDYDGNLSFNPRLPTEWNRLRMKLRFRGQLLSLDITPDTVAYELSGHAGSQRDGLTITHRGQAIDLSPGERVVRSLRPALQCVIFDLDGVITDTAEYHFQAWSRIAEELGAPIDRAFNARLKGVSRMESLELILSHGGKTLSAAEKQRAAERKNGYYRELITAITPKDLLPGVLELLGRLREEGLKTAIASVSHNVWEVVRRLEIRQFIDLIVDPAGVVKGKPDPEIFMSAAEGLDVPVENCAGVEDAQAGIDAIKSARMFAIGIGGELTGADWLLPDTHGLTFEELSQRYSDYEGKA